MTRKKMLQRCALAMEIVPRTKELRDQFLSRIEQYYNPLKDKKQAFELMERMDLSMLTLEAAGVRKYVVYFQMCKGFISDKNLQLAIVKCVATYWTEDGLPKT